MISGLRGLFVNNKKAQDSIYESGLMVFNCLKLSENFSIDYFTLSIDERTIPIGYDFYLFNYHPSTMAWMDTSILKKIPGLVLTIVLEILPNDPFVMCPDNHFHGYCVLDPRMRIKNKKVFAFPRPLDPFTLIKPYIEKEIPVIGTFGFATKGKGFHHVVDAVNKEFDKAVVKINIPFGDFVPDSEAYAKYLATLCIQRAKQGIEVKVTHDYMQKAELIEWCGQNTLNCFLYDRNIPGLAATTDQAIVSERPLSVSQNDTFRHILEYIPPYPKLSLKEAIDKSIPWVKQMQLNWSPKSFTEKFEDMLKALIPKHSLKTKVEGYFEIPILRKNLIQAINKRYRKYKRFFHLEKLKQVINSRHKRKYEELI